MISQGKNHENLIGFCEDFKIRESTIFWVVELKYPHKSDDSVWGINWFVAMCTVCNNRKVETMSVNCKSQERREMYQL